MRETDNENLYNVSYQILVVGKIMKLVLPLYASRELWWIIFNLLKLKFIKFDDVNYKI